MKQVNEENRQIQNEMVEFPTLFDSDLAEYEWMQEQEANNKTKGEAEAE